MWRKGSRSPGIIIGGLNSGAGPGFEPRLAGSTPRGQATALQARLASKYIWPTNSLGRKIPT